LIGLLKKMKKFLKKRMDEPSEENLEIEELSFSKTDSEDIVLTLNNSSKLSSHLSHYFNNNELSDVTFDFQGDKIFGHKFIVASRR
jgi:translation initiation factor 2B subunit (eIF-2B alpha/beta/delta family)